MKLKKTVLSVIACALAFVIAFAFTACGQEEETTVTISAIEIESTAEIDTGATKNVIKQITYSDGTTKTSNDSDIVWTSSNESVATVTRGVVSGKSGGTAKITATFGEVTSNECTVTVHSIEVKLTESSITLEKYGTKQLNAEIYRDGSKVNEEIEWSSSSDAIATVDANGLVTAWSKGTATITAKIKGGNQSANCDLTVNWTEPDGYAEIAFAEQNKLTPNVWGYWNGQPGWSSGEATAFEAYIEDYEDTHTAANGYEYIGINKATFAFEVTDYLANWTYQTFYRSSDNVEGGKLAYNHEYELTFKIFSNQAGEVGVNPYDDVRAQNEGESDEDYKEYVDGLINEGKLTEHNFQIEANEETTITVIFKHDDCGYKYQEGIYDNMGSAVHLQLAGLGKAGGRVQVSVYDFQFKDLGEADYPVTDDTSKHDGASTVTSLPDFSNVDSVALDIINDDDHKDQVQVGDDKGTYTVAASTDKKSYDIQYTTKTSTYEFFKVDLSGVETANYNTFAVTLKNNGTANVEIRFDLNGATATVDPNGNMTIVDCVTSTGVATGGSVKWDSDWGGTVFTVGAGETQTIYLTYACDVHGAPEELAIYCNTQWYGNESSGWQEIREERTGNITLSDFKFGTVELPEPAPTHPADPDVMPVSATTVTGVTLTVEEDKAIYNLAGTVDLSQFNNDVDEAKTWLNATHFDLQQCGGVWTNYAFNRVSVTVNTDGTFLIKYDITYLPVDTAGTGAYTGHFTEKEPSEDGYSDNHYRDIKLSEENAVPGASITVGGKKYSIVNITDYEATEENSWGQPYNYGCVSIKVENA